MAESRFSATRIVTKLLVFLFSLGVIWWLRPLFHPLIYRMRYSSGMAVFFGLTILAGVILFFLPPLSRETNGHQTESSIETKFNLFGMVFAIALILAVIAGSLGGLVAERTIAQNTMDDTVQVQEFPEANAENPRIVPRAVADVQTRGSVSYRTHKLGKSDIARMEDGRLAWSYAIHPDQFRNRISDNQRGVLLSDMTSMEDREMRAYDENEFVHGQAMLLHRGAMWNVKKGGYWSEYRDDPVEFVHNGSAYMVYPKTGHEWHFTPVPHTTPTWDGVALVHQDGTIDHLSPEEAQESEILEGQRIYPLYNSEVRAESLGYRNGIINQMGLIGSHKGVVEPAALPNGAGNSQPFVMDLEGERMTYVYAMEPAGDSTRGLDEVWFFDSRTGESRHYGTGSNTLLGPERAMGIVRSEDSRTNWNAGEGGGQFKVVEPVPTVINDKMWWHAKVVPTDNTDVTRNSFVNAHTGEVVELHDTESVVEFMSDGNASDYQEAENVTTEESNDENVSYYVVIRDSEGDELDRIPVQTGEQVEIESGE
jgi:hypothetical protein